MNAFTNRLPATSTGQHRPGRRIITHLLLGLALLWAAPAWADIAVTINGPGGRVSQTLPDSGGQFDLNMPLNRNAVNAITVTAGDAAGNSASRELAITQVSLDQIVVSQVRAERLSTQEVEQLVAEGVIDLDDAENYNVSTFDIVLTIDKRPVPISVPIAVPKETVETAAESVSPPPAANDGGNTPTPSPVQIIVFEQPIASPPGEPTPPPIPGVIIIEGNIKSLKEFFNVRLLLMNTSGIFTLSDVVADIELPAGKLSTVLPADGINSFNDILPGTGDEPGQKEQEFIIRGDAIGTHAVTVNFGGTVTGPGITDPIPFNGSATTSVEVKGPPTFLVQVSHPDSVTQDVPYDLVVNITNTGQLPALYASLELSVDADAQIDSCTAVAGSDPVCAYGDGPEIRGFGHIQPGETVSETFSLLPGRSGDISSCMAASDQNIQLQVFVGTLGCVVGHFPPAPLDSDGAPTVAVLPAPNADGIHEDAPVVAFFSAPMNRATISTGATGSFNVYDSADGRVPGALRFETMNENTDQEKSLVIWQVDDGITNRLASNARYRVVLTTDIRDRGGKALAARYQSGFSTTDTGINDITPPSLSLTVQAPVDANAVLPGQIINIDAYASDQGSGISRVELRLKDLIEPGALFELMGQRSVFAGDTPPFVFALDSAVLVPGHAYQARGTAYDGNGNAQDATLSLLILPSAAPPTVTLPASLPTTVLHGIGVTLSPDVSAAVRRVDYFLDGSAQAFKSVTLAPWQGTLSTLNRALGNHSVRVVASDGLGQTGEAVYAFELLENINVPVVGFSGVVDGAQYETGSSILVTATAEDPVGIQRIDYYLDGATGAPLYSGFAPMLLNTAGLTLGGHTITIQAENKLGISSALNDPAASFGFSLVEPPPGPPPAPPSVDNLSYPVGGLVTISGHSVAGARIDISNTTQGMVISAFANAAGQFSADLPAVAGDTLSLVAYDLANSPNPSDAVDVLVVAAPVLQSIDVTPAQMTFTAVNASAAISVVGHYDDGIDRDLSAQAQYSSSDPAVAAVDATGAVVALARGQAVISVAVDGRQAQVAVDANIITLTGISADPASLALVSIGQSAQLTVSAQYSDGSSQVLAGGVSFATANAQVAVVDSSGRVTAVGDGSTQIPVSYPGTTPVIVAVSVNSGLDPAPSATILSPADGGTVERGDLVTVTIHAEDAIGGVTDIGLAVSGAFSYSDSLQVSPAALAVTRDLSFTVPADAAIGGSIHIVAGATDTSGGSATPVAIDLAIVDQTAPQVTIIEPAQQAAFNFNDTVTLRIGADDAVGVHTLRYQTSGALSLADTRAFAAGNLAVEALFDFDIPFGLSDPDLRIEAFATDSAGNERAATPVDILLTDADITPPATEVTAVTDPGAASGVTVSYQVTAGLADLDHVLLYYRRNGLGTFNRYTDEAGGNADGIYTPQSGDQGTIAFDSTRMGGDGDYEFATVGVDIAGNHEALPQSGGTPVGDSGATAVFAVATPVTVISTDRELSDASLDDHNLRIDGATLTLVGSHSFHNVELLNGAVLTHRETSASEEPRLQFSAWTLSIDATSAIDVDGRGYLGGNKTGLGQTAHTVGFNAGAQAGNGGSYGGPGGHYSGAGSNQPNPVYGNLSEPVDLGSGGGAWSGAGGDGGGRVLMNVINLAVDGVISANGGLSAGSASGEGSGGSLNIRARSLSGSGAIRADGGTTNGSTHTGGGGGRIALRYLDLHTLNLAGVTTAGGVGHYGDGADGTVLLLEQGQSNGELVINGRGPGSPFTDLLLPPGQSFDAITLQNGARVIARDPIVISGTLRLTGDSVLTHATADEAGLRVEADRVLVDSGSAIDVSGRGYLGGNRTGLGQTAHTLGQIAGAQQGNGGSHGGRGAHYGAAGGNTTNLVYGDPKHPDRLGSGGGGGAWNGDGGNGGGRIRIIAGDEVRVDGAIRADGGLSSGSASGEGSGGSIWIDSSRIGGNGSISANGGGTDGANHSGGGGGRVAVYADYIDPNADLDGLRQVTAFRGRGHYDDTQGSAGTLYFEIGGVGELVIDDNEIGVTARVATPLPLVGPARVTAVSGDTLSTDGSLPLLANGLVGLRVNPDRSQSESFVVTANDVATITLQSPNEHGIALADIAAVDRTLVASYQYQNLSFRRGGRLAVGDRLVIDDTLNIDDYGLLTHPPTTTHYAAGLDLEAGTLAIGIDGAIDASGLGYLGGNRAGLGETAHTLDFQPGAQKGNGGSYAGLGGHYSSAGGNITNPDYGDPNDPGDLGSGGGAWNGDGGNGGGRLRITAGQIQVDGVISADGGISSGSASGEGSGGSINIRTGDLSGGGIIRANGGCTNGANHTGGGGGRIAIRYSGDLSLPTANLQVLGGDGHYGDGGHGTVFVKGPGQALGDLIIDGLGRVQPTDSVRIPGGLSFDNIELRNGVRAVADSGISVGTLHLSGDATLTHSQGNENGLVIDATRVQVDSGSAIDVSGRGYFGGNRAGLGQTAHTLGLLPGAQTGNGGSHGGLGAHYNGAGGNTTNLVYGNPERPNRLGSGGGAWNGDGGNGGGYLRITTDELWVDGALRADGGMSSGSASGEGSGGSLWVDTGLLGGDGTLSANGGGTAGANHTGGGGGRVAIYATSVDPSADLDGLRNISAFRGRGHYDDIPGSAGTVYLDIAGRGELLIDDNETTGTTTIGTPLPLLGPGVTTAVGSDTLSTDGIVPLLPNALVGLRLNPDRDQTETFAILSNTADTVTVQTPNGNGIAFTSVAAVDKVYGLAWQFANLGFRRGGQLVVGDPLQVSDTLHIGERGMLTHPRTSTTYPARLDLDIGTLSIDTDGRIDVSGRGYLGGNKTGLGQTAHTLDFQSGAQAGNGGSYAGIGGHYSGAGGNQTNPVYGDASNPQALGSGGGAWAGAGGNGGGRVFITADSIVNNGGIRADGGISSGSASGEGSGGTVNIHTGALSGSGSISADGGGIVSNHTGGGGGRIAIRSSGANTLPPANVHSNGGDGQYGDGSAGTVTIE